MPSIDSASDHSSQLRAEYKLYKDDSHLLESSNRLIKPKKRQTYVSLSTFNKKKGKINGYKKLHKLGQGSFAKVYLAEHIETGIKYAIKQMNKRTLRQR